MTSARDSGLVRLLGFVTVLALSVLLASGIGLAQETGNTYTNPVSKDFADTFADPAVIKAKDGYWYAFGTSDPLREGEGEFHTIPISRSKDLVNWKYVGDAFGELEPSLLGSPGLEHLGARHPLPERQVLHVLRRHADHRHR